MKAEDAQPSVAVQCPTEPSGPSLVNAVVSQMRRLGRFARYRCEDVASEVRFALQERAHRFDEERGVTTSSIVSLRRLAVPRERRQDCVRYEPIQPARFRRALAALPPHCAKFHFVDLGCGMGRALLLASDAGFTRITGVEFSAELANAAAENLRAARLPVEAEVTIVQKDAREFQFPTEPLVVYLYNPFGSSVVTEVFANLRRTLQSSEREVWVVYLSPMHLDAVLDCGFKLHHSSDEFAIANRDVKGA